MTLAAWVVPGAPRSQAIGVANECLRIRLAAPAVEGRANTELVRYLAGEVGIPRRDIELVRGQRSRRKVVLLRGVTLEHVKHRLGL